MIDRGDGRVRHAGSRLRTGLTVMFGLLVLGGALYAATPGVDPAERGVEAAPPAVATLEGRVDRVTRGWAELAAFYDDQVVPIERVLLRYRDDPELARRVAAAVVREAHAAGLRPRLLLGVLLVENPWLDPAARSSVGAVGLMQIMPVHQGGWSCGWDLESIETNVCLGARVFAHYLDRTGGDIERALLRYNGCVNGTNTPNCHQYPSRVLARAGDASLLAWVGGQGPSAGSP